MRTTVTLDADVEHLLKETARRRRTSFKQVLNQAVRQALTPLGGEHQEPFTLVAQPMGLKPGVDPTRLAEMADDLEMEGFLRVTRELGSPRP